MNYYLESEDRILWKRQEPKRPQNQWNHSNLFKNIKKIRMRMRIVNSDCIWCVCRYVSKCVLFPPCIDGFSGVQCSVLNWWNLERREWSNPHPFMATFVESYFSHFTFSSFWWAEQTNSWYIPISLAEKVFSPSLHLLFSPHHFTLLRSLQRANPKWRREVKCCLRTINKLWFKFYVKTIYWTAS